MIALTFDADLGRVADELQATQREAELALRSTVNRSARWLGTRLRRALRNDLRLPADTVRRRLVMGRISQQGDRITAKVWVGLNAVDLIKFGARETKAGVRTRVGTREGAFIATGKGGSRQVFKRRGDARLPIDKQAHDIKDAGDQAIEPIASGAEFGDYVLSTFERELLWRISRRR